MQSFFIFVLPVGAPLWGRKAGHLAFSSSSDVEHFA
jgi:hypothetical protein